MTDARRDESNVGEAQQPETLGITVNTAFAEQVGPDGVRRYVEVLESAAQVARDGGDVEEHLRDALANAEIQLAEPRYEVLGAQLTQLAQSGGPLTVTLDDGTVLAGPALEVPNDVPAEEGEPDPEADDRPAYS